MNTRIMFTTLLAALTMAVGLPSFAAAGNAPPSARPVANRRSSGTRSSFRSATANPAKWNLALNNARNVQQDLGEKNVDIEIVAYGPGIGMLKMDSTVGTRVSEAMATGIKVVACENTMRNEKIGREDMLSRIGYVKAGVVELMQKQQQGWAYIRP